MKNRASKTYAYFSRLVESPKGCWRKGEWIEFDWVRLVRKSNSHKVRCSIADPNPWIEFDFRTFGVTKSR